LTLNIFAGLSSKNLIIQILKINFFHFFPKFFSRSMHFSDQERVLKAKSCSNSLLEKKKSLKDLLPPDYVPIKLDFSASAMKKQSKGLAFLKSKLSFHSNYEHQIPM